MGQVEVGLTGITLTVSSEWVFFFFLFFCFFLDGVGRQWLPKTSR